MLDEDGREATDVIVHRRRLDGRQIFFLVNTSKTRTLKAIIRLSGVVSVAELLPMNGGTEAVEFRHCDDGLLEFEALLPPYASRLYLGENR